MIVLALIYTNMGIIMGCSVLKVEHVWHITLDRDSENIMTAHVSIFRSHFKITVFVKFIMKLRKRKKEQVLLSCLQLCSKGAKSKNMNCNV